MFIWVKPPQFSKEFPNILFRHTHWHRHVCDSRLTLTHSQNEYSEIRNPNVNHNTQNCETNLRCSEPCVCAVRTLTQFRVLCWIIHFINPQSTHTLLMSAWIRNRSPYHMWKPLYGNEKSLIEIVMRVTRVCVRARLPCERQRSFQPATIKWHRRTKRSLPLANENAQTVWWIIIINFVSRTTDERTRNVPYNVATKVRKEHKLMCLSASLSASNVVVFACVCVCISHIWNPVNFRFWLDIEILARLTERIRLMMCMCVCVWEIRQSEMWQQQHQQQKNGKKKKEKWKILTQKNRITNDKQTHKSPALSLSFLRQIHTAISVLHTINDIKWHWRPTITHSQIQTRAHTHTQTCVLCTQQQNWVSSGRLFK